MGAGYISPANSLQHKCLSFFLFLCTFLSLLLNLEKVAKSIHAFTVCEMNLFILFHSSFLNAYHSLYASFFELRERASNCNT